ncbi:hypothetical protein V1318_21040 [Lysobacter sp. CCNWLW3]|uniref:hypothetical protein n=1 Tax=unclassified Lysobacter TaxID=2635362 RepID=UPI002FD05583
MRRLRVLFMLCLGLAAVAPAWAGHTGLPVSQIRIDELMGDTQKTGGGANGSEMIWWLPPQLWAYVLDQQDANAEGVSKKVSQEVSRQFQDLFTRNTVIAALRIDSLDESPNFSSEADLRGKLQLVDMHGGSHRPMAADQVDPALKGLLDTMRPMLVSMIGPAGENMQFYVFPGRTADGKPVADPLGDGKMLVRLDRSEFSFRLPLGGLLPARRDPANGETFPGGYRYNPYTGAELQAVGAGR